MTEQRKESDAGVSDDPERLATVQKPAVEGRGLSTESCKGINNLQNNATESIMEVEETSTRADGQPKKATKKRSQPPLNTKENYAKVQKHQHKTTYQNPGTHMQEDLYHSDDTFSEDSEISIDNHSSHPEYGTKIPEGHTPKRGSKTGLKRIPGETQAEYKSRCVKAGIRASKESKAGKKNVAADVNTQLTQTADPTPKLDTDLVRKLQNELETERTIRIRQDEQLKKLQNQLSFLTKQLQEANKNQTEMKKLIHELKQQPHNSKSQRHAEDDQQQPEQLPAELITSIVKKELAPILKLIGQLKSERISVLKSQSTTQQQHQKSEANNKATRRWEKLKKTDFPPLPPTHQHTSNLPTVPPEAMEQQEEESSSEDSGSESEWDAPRTSTTRQITRRQQQNSHPNPTRKLPGKELNRSTKPKPRKSTHSVLLVPTTTEVTSAYNELQKLPGANPRRLGIQQHIKFPSGAVLITCQTENQTNELRTVIEQTPTITEKHIKKNPHQVKIHGVDINTPREDLEEDIERLFHEKPNEIIWVPYKNQEKKKIAVLTTSQTLYEALSKRKTIRVGWDICGIDSKIHISRCERCKLLGHSAKRCNADAPANEETSSGSSLTNSKKQTNCLDCKTYNKRLTEAKLPKYRLRNSNHNTGDTRCPTLLALKRKMMPTATEGLNQIASQ